MRDLTPDALVAVLSVLAALLVLASAVWRYRRPGLAQEASLWRAMMIGVIFVAVGVAAGQILQLLAGQGPGAIHDQHAQHAQHAREVSGMLFGIGCLAASPIFFSGLIRWNRSESLVTYLGDHTDGAASALVLMSAGNAFLPQLRENAETVSSWRLQFALAALASAVVVVMTILSVATLAALFRDKRLYVLLLALCAFIFPPAATLFGTAEAGSHGQVFALAPAALVVLASVMPATAAAPRPPATHAGASGSLVVLLAGTSQLVVASTIVRDPSYLITLFATIAVTAMSLRFLVMVRELAHLAQSRREAMTDELTGIANRRALMQALGQALDDAEHTSLLLIDLDRFKIINDRYGHAVGDELLRQVSAGFSARTDGEGLLARLGGDEFAVLLTGFKAGSALMLGRGLVESVAPVLDLDGRPLRVRASIGIASNDVILGDGTAMDAGEMLRRADTAMYQAKSSGSGVSLYDQDLDARAQQQIELADDLQCLLDPSLARQQFLVYFQPQIRISHVGVNDENRRAADGTVAGAEALIRWQHPRLGLLTPDAFIDLVEQNGLMSALTTHVVHEAAAYWLKWQAAGHDLRVSVNLSASSLAQPDLLPLLDSVFELGVVPTSFVLEITETSLMADPDVALRALQSIALRGCGISIDDYGTGYSALAYLSDLPATELKIDRSFTSRLLSDRRTAAVIAGTVELAHRLGLRLIVEGIEDADTLTAARDLGCDEAQGYYFSRPMTPDAFGAWLANPGNWSTSATAQAGSAGTPVKRTR